MENRSQLPGDSFVQDDSILNLQSSIIDPHPSSLTLRNLSFNIGYLVGA